MIHRHFGSVVRGEACGQQVSGSEFGTGAMEEGSLIECVSHGVEYTLEDCESASDSATRMGLERLTRSVAERIEVAAFPGW
ncbi:hypothetical protein GCM10010974_19790 [Brevibacterium sediminis]|uniref:Rieske domain-containing protein n=1 Tax=Brevibacterium sediminis TaxID=1857024 RepID=A0ABQ1MA16_9MICO|nr:hypothetical protein GCM10010974_19790 [Brevibacterium sediminis]